MTNRTKYMKTNLITNISMDSHQTHDLRVITFNLLSPSYVNNEYFPFVKSQHIAFQHRAEKVKKLIGSWIKVNFIICLQEVDINWKQTLDPFFESLEYKFYSIQYADNKMGQGIAYPIKHFDLIDINLFVPGQQISSLNNKLIQLFQQEQVTDIKDNEQSHTQEKDKENNKDTDMDKEKDKNKDDDRKLIMDEISNASDSKNTMISLLLSARYYGRPIGKKVIISTYHMPCSYTKKYFIN